MVAGGAPVRDIGWIRWKDPRAWMEAMRGSRWNTLVTKERQRFEAAVAAAGARDPSQLDAAVAAFETTSQEAGLNSSWILQRGTVRLRVSSQLGGVYSWTFIGGDRPLSFPYAGDITIGPGGILLTTEDRKGGQEVYAVVARSSRGQPLWSYQGGATGGAAQQIAVLGQRVFLVEAISPLQYKRLVSIDLATGKGRSVLFEDLHPSVNLRLIKGQRECLFLLAENAGYQALYHVQPTGKCQRLAPDGVAFYPVGYGAGAGARPPSFFVRRGAFSAPWDAVGTPLEDWTFPAGAAAAGIEFCSLAAGLLVTRSAGIRTLYRCGRQRPPSQLGTLLGELEFNPWDAWYGRLGLEGRILCIVTVPGATPTEGVIDMRHGLTLEHPFSVYAGRRLTGTVRSRDGTGVPWIVCLNDQRPPVGLIVCGYGAYGLPTNLSTTRWKPFLERGIAVGFALVRGGGDSGEAWAEAGRLAGKERGVEDFEACVQALQGVVDVPPSATALFGRSAGGYLVGSTVARNPDGALAGVAYCEVPYVDVLRTASNPALPLTSLEYLEFGQPAEKVADFEMLLRLSPIEALGTEGAPGVFVLSRTATEDRQVYAYESFKWVDALRGSGAAGVPPRWARPKLVGLTRGSGHFVRGAQGSIERAEDYLVLVRELLRKE